jgi:hypothetical protein
MSSYAYLYLDQDEIYHWRNNLDHSILSVFEKNDVIEADGTKAKQLVKDRKLITYEEYENDENFSVTLLNANVQTLKDRMRVLGYGQYAFDSFIENMVKYDRDFASSEHPQAMRNYYKEELQVLSEIADKYPAINDFSDAAHKKFADWLETSPCQTLFYQLRKASSDSFITLDVSEMAYEGWFDNAQYELNDTVQELERSSTRPIIITEGVFDRKVLKESIELLYPHISGFLNFLDTDFKSEGGASSVIKMLKSFAAAGISNRIIAILDNDSAAYDAKSTLDMKLLPANYVLIHYPSLKFGETYPTLGPQGRVNMDINGSAGAIELYLGKDVLTDPDGELYPVQWTGYIKKLGKYQGELLDKSFVQKNFEKKLKLAKNNSDMITNQDWSSIKLIVEHILDSLEKL